MTSGCRRLLGAGLLFVCVLSACTRAKPDGQPAPPSRPLTFNKDIAPLVFQNCAPCHRPGQAAPFTLLTYADVKSRAAKIVTATKSRRMPPWLPDLAETPTFLGERRLSQQQIASIERWVNEGAPEGAPADLPETPRFAEGWEFGTPDLVLTLARPYILKPSEPGSHDIFRNVVLPVNLPAGRYVRAVEFRPGTAPVVHHSVISIDRTRASRHRDGTDGQVGYDGMIVQDAQSPDGHFIGWTPGKGPIVAPDGLPWRLERGSDLVVQLHLLPGKEPVPVQPTVGLFFTDTPPKGGPVMVKLGSRAIEIPAGEPTYRITDTYVLPVDVDLLSIYPHAHYLGKEMEGVAVLPDGSSRQLLHIKRWDFHWQQDYRYVKPVPLPRGTRLTMNYTYDNSETNRHNPHNPPVQVLFGPNSHDEMGDLWLQVLPRSAADGAILSREFAQREALSNVAGAEMQVRHAPNDAKQQTYLGSSYADVGRLQEAAAHLAEALRLDPKSAAARNYMGGVLVAQRRVAEAVVEFRQAAALSPRDERMHFNLGNALAALGQGAEAARAYERALAVNPDFAPAHQNLGVYLVSAGRLPQAIEHLKRAAAITPDSAEVLGDLGAALAEAGRPDEAKEQFRRALELKPDDTVIRENLARLERRR